VRLFLRAHGRGLAPSGSNRPRLLVDRAAVLQDLDLAARLVLDRLLDEAERVDVLDLAARAELPAGLRTETFTSARRLPFSMSPSQVPSARTMVPTFLT
jgi:hypothetical protein